MPYRIPAEVPLTRVQALRQAWGTSHREIAPRDSEINVAGPFFAEPIATVARDAPRAPRRWFHVSVEIVTFAFVIVLVDLFVLTLTLAARD